MFSFLNVKRFLKRNGASHPVICSPGQLALLRIKSNWIQNLTRPAPLTRLHDKGQRRSYNSAHPLRFQESLEKAIVFQTLSFAK
jgi:hypothetical protein